MARDVTCSGCGRRIAVSPNRLPGYIYCEDPADGLLCADQPPAGQYEERDAFITEMAQRWPAKRIAESFGVSRQRVQQIIQARRGE